MAGSQAPLQLWDLNRLDEWRRVLDQVSFTSDYNRPYATGSLLPGGPDDAEAVLRKWRRPVLILHGRDDLTFPITAARRLHAALPASTLAEIPDAAHMAHFDNPAPWQAAIREFTTGAAPYGGWATS